MSTHGYANQAFADQAHEAFRTEQEQKRADATNAAHTRTQLEAPAEPAPEDDDPPRSLKPMSQRRLMTLQPIYGLAVTVFFVIVLAHDRRCFNPSTVLL